MTHAWKATRCERKLRLVTAAARDYLTADGPDPVPPELLDLAARVADGEASDAERAAGYATCGHGQPGFAPHGYPFLNWSAYQGGFRTFSPLGHTYGGRTSITPEATRPYADLVLDVYGHLFRVSL